jgi:hypothetical protein
MRYVEIAIGGKIRKLRYDFNALADLEERAGSGIAALVASGNMGYNTIRLFLWAGLKWEDKGLTPARVGTWLQEFLEGGGEIATLMEYVTHALKVSGVTKEEEDDQGNAETEAAN